MSRTIQMVMAVDTEDGIAKDGKLPWHNKDEFANFQHLTTNSFCIMGRNTFEEIASMTKTSQILPSRYCLVLTKDVKDLKASAKTKHNTLSYNNVMYVDSLETALKLTFFWNPNRTVSIIGGAGICEYALTNNIIDVAFITIMNGQYECDKLLDMRLVRNTLKNINTYTDHKDFTVYRLERSSHQGAGTGLQD